MFVVGRQRPFAKLTQATPFSLPPIARFGNACRDRGHGPRIRGPATQPR